jgi:hypothetical protein
MRFAYMDEAGNTGRKLDDANQPIHLILSVVIDEEKIPLVHEHIRKTGRRHCPGVCRRSDFEFHGSDLFASRGHFSEMNPEKRIEIFDDVLQGIELAGADVVIRGVEKAGLERRYSAPKHRFTSCRLTATERSSSPIARPTSQPAYARSERELCLLIAPHRRSKSFGRPESSPTSGKTPCGTRAEKRPRRSEA